MKFKILSDKPITTGYLKVRNVQLQHDTYSGEKQLEIERDYVAKGEAVAVLVYEKDTDSILFTKQFRFTTTNFGDGWLLEIPAGMLDEGETPEEGARRELAEELGYEVENLQHIFAFYLTPGYSSERIHLFYAEVTSADKKQVGGGKESEQEDILLVKKKVAALNPEDNELFGDAKTIVGLQWFLLSRNRR